MGQQEVAKPTYSPTVEGERENYQVPASGMFVNPLPYGMIVEHEVSGSTFGEAEKVVIGND